MTSNSASGSDQGPRKLTQEEIEDLRREMQRDGLWAKNKLRKQRERRAKLK
jgi:hypothetical protein